MTEPNFLSLSPHGRHRVRLGLRVAAAAALAAVMLGVAGCAPSVDETPVDESSWVLSAVTLDDIANSGAEVSSDVGLATGWIAPDTANGFWVESGLSWLHVNEAGAIVTTFNPGHPAGVNGASALSPTRLIVSVTDSEYDPHPGSGLFLVDTETGTWENLIWAAALGDVVALPDGSIAYVEFAADPTTAAVRVNPGTFAIRHRATTGEITTLLDHDPARTVTAVKIDASRQGAIVVATDTETFTLTGSGEPELLGEYSTTTPARPILAVSPAGEVLASSSRNAGGDIVSTRIVDSSREARELIETYSVCASPPALGGGTGDRLAFLCTVQTASWISNDTIVFSGGGEDGAVLVLAHSPRPR